MQGNQANSHLATFLHNNALIFHLVPLHATLIACIVPLSQWVRHWNHFELMLTIVGHLWPSHDLTVVINELSWLHLNTLANWGKATIVVWSHAELLSALRRPPVWLLLLHSRVWKQVARSHMRSHSILLGVVRHRARHSVHVGTASIFWQRTHLPRSRKHRKR